MSFSTVSTVDPVLYYSTVDPGATCCCSTGRTRIYSQHKDHSGNGWDENPDRNAARLHASRSTSTQHNKRSHELLICCINPATIIKVAHKQGKTSRLIHTRMAVLSQVQKCCNCRLISALLCSSTSHMCTWSLWWWPTLLQLLSQVFLFGRENCSDIFYHMKEENNSFGLTVSFMCAECFCMAKNSKIKPV